MKFWCAADGVNSVGKNWKVNRQVAVIASRFLRHDDGKCNEASFKEIMMTEKRMLYNASVYLEWSLYL